MKSASRPGEGISGKRTGSATARGSLAASSSTRQPDTVQVVPSLQEPTAIVEIDSSLPRGTGADGLEPTLDLSGRPTFDVGGGSGLGAADTPGFWPMSLSQGVFGFDHTGDGMGFPQPESVQYQAMHFLADLSVVGSQNEQVWGSW